MSRLGTILTLFVSYAVGVLATRMLTERVMGVDAATLAALVIVPTVQAVVCLAWPAMVGRVIMGWTVLGVTAALATYGGGYLIFHRLDLSFLQFAVLLVAPLVQACALGWRARQPAEAWVALVRTLLRLPLAQPVLGLDVVMLIAGIVWWDSRTLGLGNDVRVQSAWVVIKTVAALLFTGRALSRAVPTERTIVWRALVPLLLIAALNPSTSWLAAAFRELHIALGLPAEILQRLVFYATLFTVLVALTLRAARSIRALSPVAFALWQVSVAGAIGVAVPATLASFNLPEVTQPWLGLATLSASVAATSVLLGAIALASDER